MHTQKAWCAGVDAYDDHYLLVAKKNQPGVRQDLLDFFADKELDQDEWSFLDGVKRPENCCTFILLSFLSIVESPLVKG